MGGNEPRQKQKDSELLIRLGGQIIRGVAAVFDIVSLGVEVDRGTLKQGLAYYHRQNVVLLQLDDDEFLAEVMEPGGNCHVALELDEQKNILLNTGCCTCQAYWEYSNPCKHIIAAAFKAQDELKSRHEALRTSALFDEVNTGVLAAKQQRLPSEPAKRKSDQAATNLLKARAQLVAWETEQARNQRGIAMLEPILHEEESYYYRQSSWNLTFKVGVKKLYVVMNLNDFKTDVVNSNIMALGKKESMWAGADAFNEQGRAMLDFIMQHHNPPPGYYEYYGGRKKELHLAPVAVDAFFELLEGKTLKSDYYVEQNGAQSHHYYHGKRKKTGTLSVIRDDFPLRLRLERKGDGVILRSGTSFRLIEGLRHLHVLSADTIYICSEEYSDGCRDLLRTLESEAKDYQLFFEEADIPTLFTTLISEIEPFVDIDIEAGLDEFVPPPLETRIYFDVTEYHDITAYMTFSYGEQTHDAFARKNTTESFDLAGEYRAEHMLMRYIDEGHIAAGTLMLSGGSDEKLYELATVGMDELSQIAELFISDAFRRLSVRPSTAVSVGVKVEGGLLAVDFDIDGLDFEELAEVLAGYRKAKRFIRLSNGALISLEQGALSQLAEMAEVLELTPAQLAEGHVELELNRALYLDALLKENEELRYQRDDQLRGIVRAMKDITDAEFPLPHIFESVLRNYQQTGYRWLRTIERLGFGGILADDMGLGKTIQVLALLQAKREEADEHLPSIVVCPASLVLNWQSEAARFAPDLQVAALVGGAAERRQAINEHHSFDLLVTSYDQLKRDIERYEGHIFDFVILDEAQMIKNQNTQNAKAVKLLAGHTRLALTGTPVENSLAELWSIFDFLMPGYLKGYHHFKKKYETTIVKQHDKGAIERLRSLVRPFILRRLKREVLKELPEKIESVLSVALVDEQRKLYLATLAQTKKELATRLAEHTGGQNQIAILAALTRLRQLCCDPSLVFADYQGGSVKLNACLELIESSRESGHRMLLFSQFTSMLDILERELGRRGISFYRLDGSTPKVQRLNLVNEFNAGDTSVFLISLKAGGTGLNLIGADVVIHYDPWWNLSAQNQATDRTHRIGQQRTVQVLKLIAKDTIEERIQKLQEQKAELAQTIIQEGGNAFESLSGDELMALFEDEAD
jgi:hypothetical protein